MRQIGRACGALIYLLHGKTTEAHSYIGVGCLSVEFRKIVTIYDSNKRSVLSERLWISQIPLICLYPLEERWILQFPFHKRPVSVGKDRISRILLYLLSHTARVRVELSNYVHFVFVTVVVLLGLMGSLCTSENHCVSHTLTLSQSI